MARSITAWDNKLTDVAEQHDEDQAEHGGSSNADGVAKAKQSVKKKMPLREAINDTQTQQKIKTVGKEQCLPTCGVSCEKPVISLTKTALAGRVKNWAVTVHKSTSDVQNALQSTNSVPKKAPLPASTSAATGSSSKTLAVSNVEGPPPTESIGSTGRTVVSDKLDPTPDGPDDLTGSFGDDLDDDVEREATLLNKKQLNTVSITCNLKEDIPIEIDSDSESQPVEADAESQLSPSLKRKQSELLDRHASDHNEEVMMRTTEDAYCNIDVEMGEGEESQNGQSAVPRFTTQTMVMAINNPPPKKAKRSEPTNVAACPTGRSAKSLNYFKTNVEPDWFKKDPWQDGWKSKILPTLCLWAGAQSNMWSTPKDRVANILRIVVPTCVGAAYQHLCNWRHGVGSVALALCTSFFMDSQQETIATEAGELLENNSFLYEDLDSNDSLKAFHSNFIIHLLATTYIPAIKGFVHEDGLNTYELAHRTSKEY
ncbi:hypothetical protein OG21DRAFT_1491207 [Imleria badia]|nr:hypothetical protein OG21DRAFT_1491207 [Imleria badia]